ncbi:MAG: hypothetical protein R3D84_07365 [Paracoccaceae bacterium]
MPDDAAREAAALAAGLPVRLIDASTAHRVDPDWVFGFAEMAKDQRAAIAGAKRGNRTPGAGRPARSSCWRPWSPPGWSRRTKRSRSAACRDTPAAARR